jgi:pyrimidine deaminase RibD-like protein
MALRQFEGSLEGVFVFVTLEPCSFQGRTPSCALTLIERGAKAVFVSVIDPHPRNRGEGIHLLREAGVTVETGILQERVMGFIGPYLNNV